MAHLVQWDGLLVEPVGCLDHDEGRADEQVVSLQEPVLIQIFVTRTRHMPYE